MHLKRHLKFEMALKLESRKRGEKKKNRMSSAQEKKESSAALQGKKKSEESTQLIASDRVEKTKKRDARCMVVPGVMSCLAARWFLLSCRAIWRGPWLTSNINYK